MKGNQHSVRCGYPIRRISDPERIRKKGVMNANLLERFTMQDGKVMQLHATRGWRVY